MYNHYLNILLVRTGAAVVVILEVIGAEYFTTSVALHRKEIQLSAAFLTALFTQVGQLHCAQLRILLSGTLRLSF